jgi:hypothetical protein
MDLKGYFLIIIDKKKYISNNQHATDMGIKLCKAELALKYKLNYIRHKDLLIKSKNY